MSDLFWKLREHYRGKRVLVTGSHGFIGGHISRALVDLDADVTALDQSTCPRRESLINAPEFGLVKRVTAVEGSVTDVDFMTRLIDDGDFQQIFNFAAYATVIEKAVTNPLDTLAANAMGLASLLEAVRRGGHQPDFIFHASTDKVYGESNGEPYDEEKTPLRALGVYDTAKLAADCFARMYHEIYGLPTVVLRLCNIFGPADFNTGYRLVPKAMKSLFAAEAPAPPELYFESIEHRRDFLYVADCVHAILLLGANPHTRGQAFNLPGCCHVSTPEMCKAIVEIAEQVERECGDRDRAEQIRKNGVVIKVTGQQANVITIKVQRSHGDKLRRVTGFEPRISLQEGLTRTAKAYRDYYRSRVVHRNGNGHAAAAEEILVKAAVSRVS